MDKRKAENLRVKQSITNALFALMREKSLSDVQITELVGRAGVARASFYRNYDSKEDVLITLVRDVLERFRGEISFHESIEGTMASSSIQRYQLYAYIGALLNTGQVWLSGDARTSPEDMARYFWGAASKMLGQIDGPLV